MGGDGASCACARRDAGAAICIIKRFSKLSLEAKIRNVIAKAAR